jgi:hypothetical protein
MSLFTDLLGKAKGAAVSAAGQQFLATYLERYGTVEQFQLDPAAKVVRARLRLKGEADAIELTASGYEIGGTAAQPTVQVARVSASREWVQAVLKDFVEDRPFDLPPQAGPFLKMLL